VADDPADEGTEERAGELGQGELQRGEIGVGFVREGEAG